MADENDGQNEPGRKKKGRLTQLLIVIGLMVAEGVGVFLLADHISGTPEAAMGAEEGGPAATGEAKDPAALAEVELAECRPGNSSSGKYVSLSIRVTALVAMGDQERAQAIVKEKQARIQDRINYVIRSATLKHLQEPGFDTIRRRIKHEMEALLGEELAVKGILIPELLQ